MAWIWTFSLAIVFLTLFQKLRKKKRLPPGPIGLPILGHFHLLGKNPHQDLYNLARKYGPIMGMRFGFVPTVVVSSPAAAELFLKTHDLNFASRPHNESVNYIAYEQRGLVWGRYGPYWRNMRKLCTVELLSAHKINQFRATRRAEVGLLVDLLKQCAELGEVVDVSARVFGLSWDMNSRMVLGSKYSEGDMDVKSLVTEMMGFAAKFNVGDYFPYVGKLDLHGINREMKRLSSVVDAWLEKIIDDHKRSDHILDTLMSIIKSGEATFEFDRRNVKALLLDLLVAGADTTAASVEWTLSELVRHPTIMKKLQNELESVVGIYDMVEESHLDKLQYLDCVVKEAFRLHPVVPLLIPHESVEDCVVDGFHIPKKSRIIINAWSIGRDPSTWPNPNSFIPDRFIGSNVDPRGHDFQLIPFGSGRRGCPGLQLGLTVLKLVVAQLAHCFHWQLPNGMLPDDMDMSDHFGIVTARAAHLMAIPTYRLLPKI